jgi:tRNA (mo5U34)-methyltransferase
MTRTDEELRTAIAAHSWYHTLDLRPGVSTPGWFDTRQRATELPFPDLGGKRCLDVGTFDGFWAFDMERRGATEVVAVDVLDPRGWDWPWGSRDEVTAALTERKSGGTGFVLAAAELSSRVVRHELSVYDLDPAVHGQFDFVYLGSLLLHLRDPVRAIERVRAVLAPTGRALIVDAIDVELSLLHPRQALAGLDALGRPWWWYPNRAGLARIVTAGGLRILQGPTVVYLRPGTGQPVQRPARRTLLRRAGRSRHLLATRGDPHAWILAAPRPAD